MSASPFDGVLPVHSRAAGPARQRVLRSAAYRRAFDRAVSLAARAMREASANPCGCAAVAPRVVEAAIRAACAETPGALDNFGPPTRPLRPLDLLLFRAAALRAAAFLKALDDTEEGR